MADVLVNVNVGFGDPERFVGKTVNVYTTWANAYAQDSSNLATIYAATVNASTPAIAKGSGITQVAKTTGVTVDMHGCIKFYASQDTQYFLAMDDTYFPNGFKITSPAA
jgi:hypothetical protein